MVAVVAEVEVPEAAVVVAEVQCNGRLFSKEHKFTRG